MAHHGGGGMLMPQTFGEVVAFSEIMARSQHAIPKHLREVPGACLAVAMQAMRWEMDPFAVASKSYNVKDIIAYEAQLIAAVVHTRAPLKTRPVYTYAGEGADRRCTVTAMFHDGIERSYESPRIADIKIKNSPLWVADPDQQQGYYSIRAFARRYCPEVILGVYTPEEAQTFQGPDNARDVTPRASVPFSQRIAEIGHTESATITEYPQEASGTAREAPSTDSGTADENQDVGTQSAPPLNSDSSQALAPPHDAETDKPAAVAPPGAAGDLSPSTLPEGWAILYAAALRRAQKKESLEKYAKQFWDERGGWAAIKVTVDGATASAIFNVFKDHFGNREQIELLLRELI
jgi:hypothetical protein